MTPGTPDIAELKRLVTAAKLAFANAAACVRSHHGVDEEPRWLKDCGEDIVKGEKAVASLLASAEEAERLRAENERLTEESARLRVGLNSAVGYMMNAQIDLRTGAPKQTAINTINGGIDVLRAALGAPK